MKKNFLCIEFLSLAGLLSLMACSNSVTETTVYHNDDIAVLESGKKLKKQTCDSVSMGELLYVTDSTELFLCDGKKWVSLKGSDGKQGEKGKDGEKGDTGPKGDSGESLAGETGLQGPKGDEGVAGTSCKIVNDKDGVVVIKCGDGEGADSVKIFKSICGHTPFDPEKAFCVNGEAYSCGGKPYNPLREACVEGKTFSCEGKPYNPSRANCVDGVVYSCNETPYDPAKQMCDTRDGQLYNIVKVGSRTWMAENLNFDYNVKTAKSYCYDNKPENCKKYGRLYTWAAAVDSAARFSDDCIDCGYYAEGNVSASVSPFRGACPEGWHLTTSAEWSELVTVASSDWNSIGGVLKSTDGWDSYEGESGNGTDGLGLAIKPAGLLDEGAFTGEKQIGRFWNYANYDGGTAFTELFSYSTSRLNDGRDYRLHKATALSVRCVMNYSEE